MDNSTGKLLNAFTGHVNEAYRCRACFGHAEASVVCGDEKGQVWAWDLLDVCPLHSIISPQLKTPSRQKSYSQIRLLKPMKNLLRGLNIILPTQVRWSLPVRMGRWKCGSTQTRKTRILFPRTLTRFKTTYTSFCKIMAGRTYRLFWLIASKNSDDVSIRVDWGGGAWNAPLRVASSRSWVSMCSAGSCT